MLRTRASIALGLLYGMLSTLEFIVEDEGLDWRRVSFSDRLLDILSSYPEDIIEMGRVEFYSSQISGSLVRSFNFGNSGIEVVLSPGFGDRSLASLYRYSVDLLLLDRGIFRDKAFETSRTGIEYMFIYLETGDVALFEGEHHRVRLPFVSSSANLHTHPEGACGLSKPDVESGLDLLINGGIVSASATPSCLAYMVRIYLVLEDDYTRVKEALYYKRPLPSGLKSIEFGVRGY